MIEIGRLVKISETAEEGWKKINYFDESVSEINGKIGRVVHKHFGNKHQKIPSHYVVSLLDSNRETTVLIEDVEFLETP